ncbi:MAG: restriction endonuclease [Cytophagales bacterium]|nr:restriction endonuclease [Cytophagales bacterium]
MAILKASGEIVPFSKEKLTKSMLKAGASYTIIEEILHEIELSLHHKTTTNQIYKKAFRLLKLYSKPIAARYKLKKAIAQLGPSGYPFERFMAEILNFQGYQTQLNQLIPGRCVNHEVDVLARNDHELIMLECKFHNRAGYKSDIKVPLYIKARFDDLKNEWQKLESVRDLHMQAWIATNTRFSEDAIKYAKCAGLHLISWDYPSHGSLRERIDLAGLYPLTCLSSLSKGDKHRLLHAKNMVLCKDLLRNPMALHELGLKTRETHKVLKEINELLAFKA